MPDLLANSNTRGPRLVITNMSILCVLCTNACKFGPVSSFAIPCDRCSHLLCSQELVDAVERERSTRSRISTTPSGTLTGSREEIGIGFVSTRIHPSVHVFVSSALVNAA